MKTGVVVTSTLLCLVLAAAAIPRSAMAMAGTITADIENEKIIRKMYDEFQAAWNAHKPDQLADMWAIDGDQLEPDGRIAKGQEEVRALFTKQHNTIFAQTTLDLTIDSVWFVDEKVALVDGGYSISGIVAPDGRAIPQRKGHLTAMLIFEREQWRVAASRLMIPTAVPYRKMADKEPKK